MEKVPRPLPFSAFEWLLSGRYLRARRKEGFISVIAGFSFLGIMLGVSTLIIVMAVMNGFRKELIDKIVEVADALEISYKTVANTTSLLKQKLGAKNHSDLIRIAVEMGLG